jgi:hypothetical protein
MLTSRIPQDTGATQPTPSLPLPLKDLLQRIEARTKPFGTCERWDGPFMRTVPTLRLEIRGKGFNLSVRRVRWLSLNGPPPKRSCIVSSCGIHSCVAYEHLQERTTKEYYRQLGKRPHKRSFPIVHHDSTVKEAVRLYHQGSDTTSISRKLGVPARTIQSWIVGKARKQVTGIGHIPGGYWKAQRKPIGEKNPAAKISMLDVLCIALLVQVGYTQTSVGKAFSYAQSCVSDIVHGVSWKHVTHELFISGSLSTEVVEDGPHPDEALVYQHWTHQPANPPPEISIKTHQGHPVSSYLLDDIGELAMDALPLVSHSCREAAHGY